jgi:hypothetical protein
LHTVRGIISGASLHPSKERGPLTGGDLFAYAASGALASVAAFFSLRGLVVLFSFAPSAVVWLGLTLEATKLVAAGWFVGCWRTVWWPWRAAVIAGIAGLMVVNAAGTFSQLVSAHVGNRGSIIADLGASDATVQAKIEMHGATLAGLDRQIAQLDAAIASATAKGKAKTGLAAVEGQRHAQTDLVEKRKAEAAIVAGLKGDHAQAVATGRRIENEAAPIKAFADMIGLPSDDERAVRWFIAFIVLCCDPLAIALTAATSGRRR